MDKSAQPVEAQREGAVKTFIIDWPVLILLGLVFGALGREMSWKSAAFIGGFASAAAFTAVAMLSYVIAPDWMWMYFLDPSDVSWALPLIPLGYLFVFVLSYAAAITLRQTSRGAVVGAIGGAVAMEIAVIALTWDRYHLVGNEAEWLNGSANELFSVTPDGDAKTIGLLGPLSVALIVVCLVIVWRNARASAADR